jgi:type I restriction enzyme S subunit
MVKLKDCCNVVGGATPRRDIAEYWDYKDIPWITPKDVSNLNNPVLEDAPEYISKKGFKSCSTYLLPKGSVLLTSRAPIGNVAIAGRDMCTNQGFKSLVPSDDIDSTYLYYCMLAYSEKLQVLGNGATFKEVSKKIVEEFEIPLPPLDEQKRIATILDKADSLRRKRQQASQLADEFLRAVFLDLFGDPVTNPKGWKAGVFNNICVINPKTDKYKDELLVSFVPMQRVSENSSTIDLREKRPYMEVKKGFTAFLENDVLFAKITPCMENGKAGIARNLENGVGFGSTEFHVFRPYKLEYAEFIYSLVHLELFRKLAADHFNGAVGHKRVPKGFLENFPIYLPPYELIRKYCNIFNQVKVLLNNFENIDIYKLFNSLSQKAFAGEL